jgi:hypothetical protein
MVIKNNNTGVRKKLVTLERRTVRMVGVAVCPEYLTNRLRGKTRDSMMI